MNNLQQEMRAVCV